ncbi:MAG: hypothetical protein ABJC66_13510 [Gammaproteobacteria bacterium]
MIRLASEFKLLPWRVAALGYPFLARLSLAAVMSLGPCAGVLAGSIDGAIVFPSQLVPSMTMYATDLDSSRVRTLRLARGQTSFSIDVPPGRYVVFLAPNEPGAPNIYGAYTHYSLCAPHEAGKCEEHALVETTVTAKTRRSAVIIDDWYLTDDIAEQIDRIRGIAAGGDSGSEPLSAPRFSEYPSAPFDASLPPKVDLGGSELSEEDRATVQAALANGPNFAGQVTATLASCGLGCGRVVLVDWRSGTVRQLAAPNDPADRQASLPCRPEEALLFRRDSRLLIVTRVRGTAVVTQYFVWNQNNAALVPRAEYRRTSQTFCAVAAR